jgi:hypothetical protein
VGELQPTELGFADMSELAATLGVDESELGNMSIEQLQETSRKQFEQEFNRVGALEQQANDPNLGPAERAEARKSLKDAGATGVRSIESDADKLADQIADADEVMFNGEEVSVKELLSDEMISGLAARYLDAPEGDPFVEDLKKSEPELTEFFDSHAALLKQATAELDADVAAFAEIQKKNQDVGKIPDLPEIPKEILAAVIPNWGSLSAEVYDVSTLPTLQTLSDKTIPLATRTNIRDSLTTISQFAPELAGNFLTLTPEELAASGLSGPAGNATRDNIVSYLKDSQNLPTMSAQNPDGIAQTILGPGKTWQDLLTLANRSASMNNSGLFPSASPLDMQLLDAITEGPQQVLTVLNQRMPKATDLRNLIANPPFSPSVNLQKAGAHAVQTNEAFEVVAKYFNHKDGQFSVKDAEDLLKTQGPAALEMVAANPILAKKISKDLLPNIEYRYKQAALPELNKTLANSKLYTTARLDDLLSGMEPSADGKVRGSGNQIKQLNNAQIVTAMDTYGELSKQLAAVDKRKNPFQHKMLSDIVNKHKARIKAHAITLAQRFSLGETTPEENRSISKMFKSPIGRAIVGNAIAGPIGLGVAVGGEVFEKWFGTNPTVPAFNKVTDTLAGQAKKGENILKGLSGR